MSIATLQDPQTAIDPMMLRQTFGHFPSGVAAISARVEGQAEVMVASSFSVGVSLDPALALFSVQKISSTWPRIARAKRIGVSILAVDQARLCRQLAGRDRASRLAGVDSRTTEEGAVLVNGAAAWFDCSIHAVHEAGDHDVVIFQVHDLGMSQDISPLVFHGSRFTGVAPSPADR
ncbi:flavin reductase family protein [Arthrobacter mangrovi]|uniref:Oxidoreductase n=1 Tax=Arthrobacter mangrovi TaxID=2966350 RepID=A0ABQ5MYU8_9MICC|nr:flavin reductase family protein [Arthrobacter mangrovi]GLB69131.1 putative oxidoreductase [Arthrobacter mangrovi]